MQYFNIEYLFAKINAFFIFVVNASNSTLNSGPAGELKLFLLILTLILLAFCMYSAIGIFDVRKHEHEHMRHSIEHAMHGNSHGETHQEGLPHEETNHVKERWESIIEHVRSANPAEWRLAIIEADSILDEVLENTGYRGATLGERLKDAEGSFRSVQTAWEAHKVRNEIAHVGSKFDLSHHEALETIANYREVFEELKYL